MAVAIDSRVRERLVRTVASAKSEVRAVLRARIVLAAADGLSNGAIARQLEVSVNTVRKWRGRFAALGPDGLRDAERSGRPKIYGPEVRVAIVAAATSMPPHPEATWSHRAVAQHVAGACLVSVSASQVGRILAGLDLKPHKVQEGTKRRLGVRRLDQGLVRLLPDVVQPARLHAHALPLGFHQPRGIEVGHLEPASQVHEGCRLANAVQRLTVVPGPGGPGDLRQVVRPAINEGQTLERFRAADRPPPLVRPCADLQRLAVRQHACDGRMKQRIKVRGRDGNTGEAAFRLGPERCGEAAAGRDIGVQGSGIRRGGHGS
ncbi:hypothetical protein ASE41_20910 [Streptomyces sp. Root264]|nr:hypothetical protein ASE41_20910 [Streptomyces sp. Root264]